MRVLLAAVLLTAACGGDDENGSNTAAADSATVEDSIATTALLSIPRAFSMAEVEFGQLAAQRAASPAIRQYAQTIAADHRALIALLDSVAQLRRANLAPTPDAAELENTVRMAHSGLENLNGAQFDLPFIRAEVESHRLLLDRLDQQLIPSATSSDLRNLLTDIRAMVDAHLARARQLLAQQLGESPQPMQQQQRQAPRPPPTRPDTI